MIDTMVRWAILACACGSWLGTGCGDDAARSDEGSTQGVGASSGAGAAGGAGSGANGQGGNAANGGAGAGGPVDPCAPDPGDPPTIAAPTIANRNQVYTPNLQAFGIENDGTDPIGTRDGLNAALQEASDQGYGTFRLPAGTYLIGEKTNDIYTDGISLPGGMVFEMDANAVLQMATNDTWNYCAISVTGKEDVIITGGEIRGDRDTHVYAGGGAHDEGHTICIQGASKRVLVDGVRLTKAAGDGVLIVGQSEKGSCEDIIIRNSEIHDNRRQGVSIVGGIRVLIEDNEIHHIAGTAPQFGIDIESLSFTSDSILIRNNSFHHNAGGDFVNTDGTNVWFEDNVCDQTGLEEIQTDGPIVHWNKTDQVIRNNTITVTVGSSNGLWGIIGYSNKEPRENPRANHILDNTFIGGGLHMAHNSHYNVTGNQLDDWMILGVEIQCTRLRDNHVVKADGETFKLKNVWGQAEGNTVNGEAIHLPMTDDAPFTNSPPHLW